MFYQKDSKVYNDIINELIIKIDLQFNQNIFNKVRIDNLKTNAENILKKIYSKGIINLRSLDKDKNLKLLYELETFDLNVNDYFTISTAKKYINEQSIDELLKNIIIDLIQVDIIYNDDWTVKMLEKDLLSVHDVYGLIEKDSLIIKKNQLINDDLHQILFSYKESLGIENITTKNYYLMFLGKFFLFVLYYLYSIYLFQNIISQ